VETKVKERPKPRLRSDLVVGDGYMDIESLRGIAKREPAAFIRKAQDLANRGELGWGKIRYLPRFYNAFADVQVPAHMEVMGQTRTIMASALPLLSGLLTVAGMQDAYEAVPTIGQELVTEDPDPNRVSIYAAVSALDVNVEEVQETADFPVIGADEEFAAVLSKRNGRRIAITREMFERNEVGRIRQLVEGLGEIAADRIETQTLRRVTDHDGSASSAAEPYVYRRNGAGTALYSATANTPCTRTPSGTRVQNNALADTTDLNAARAVLAAMQNNRGERIAIPLAQCILLVPDTLDALAWKILNQDYESGIINELSAWGLRGKYRPRSLSSPKLDDLSTSAWYLGPFPRQFVRKWAFGLEYLTLGMETESYLVSRIAFQARVAWDCEVGAKDCVYVVQNLSGTTAPKDEA